MKLIHKIIDVTAICLFSFMIFSFEAIKTAAYVTIKAEIPVRCLEVSDDNPHSYEIKIESENDISPVPNSDILKITENGTGVFEINITEPRTFRYRIYQVAGSNPNIQYDSHIYEATVFVENDANNELTCSVIMNIAGRTTKPENIEFQNVILGETDIVTTISTTSVSTETTTADTDEPKTTTTSETTKSDKNHKSPIIRLIDSVLTGDSFPIHVVGLLIVSSFLTAISTFLFKRNHSEEEDENEK